MTVNPGLYGRRGSNRHGPGSWGTDRPNGPLPLPPPRHDDVEAPPPPSDAHTNYECPAGLDLSSVVMLGRCATNCSDDFIAKLCTAPVKQDMDQRGMLYFSLFDQ